MIYRPWQEAIVRCFLLALAACALIGIDSASAKGGHPLHLFESQQALVSRAEGSAPQLLDSPKDLLTGCAHGHYREHDAH
jgi:hypothetical protein